MKPFFNFRLYSFMQFCSVWDINTTKDHFDLTSQGKQHTVLWKRKLSKHSVTIIIIIIIIVVHSCETLNTPYGVVEPLLAATTNVITFCMTSSVSHFAVEEFWPARLCSIAAVHWDVWRCVHAQHRSISVGLMSGLWLGHCTALVLL